MFGRNILAQCPGALSARNVRIAKSGRNFRVQRTSENTRCPGENIRCKVGRNVRPHRLGAISGRIVRAQCKNGEVLAQCPGAMFVCNVQALCPGENTRCKVGRNVRPQRLGAMSRRIVRAQCPGAMSGRNIRAQCPSAKK